MCSRTFGACRGLSSQSRRTANLSRVSAVPAGTLLAGLDVQIEPQDAAEVPEQPLARDRERSPGDRRCKRVEVLALDPHVRECSEQSASVTARYEVRVGCGLARRVGVVQRTHPFLGIA